MRRALPILLALVAAVAVAVVVTDIDSRYEATASATVQVLFETGELDALRRVAGLSEIEESPETPFLPGGSASRSRVELGTARLLGGDPSFETDDVRTIDTVAELVTPELNDPVRRLKVKAIAESPEQAARLANVYLAEYLRERQRAIERLLAQAQERFRTASTPILSRMSPGARGELVEAADVAAALRGGVLTGRVVPASPPEDTISPSPVRDVVVAGLTGALLGWLLLQAGSLARRSNSSRLRSTIASRL